MIEPGDKVKDPITGFKGIVVACTDWLNGCVRITVQPQAMREGKPIEPQTFDELQLRVVKKADHCTVTATGGPRDDRTALKRN